MKQRLKGVAVVLLHLLLISHFSDARNQQLNMTVELPKESLCDNDTCHVTQRNFIDLQRMIGSNRIIVFEKATFTVAEEFDPIYINHVFNLTIQGGDGTTIHCPSEVSFGFKVFSNVSEIKITGLRIDTCASFVAYGFRDTYSFVSTAIFIESSRNITLANVHVQNSEGFSVIAYDPTTLFTEYNDLFWNHVYTYQELHILKQSTWST